MKYTILVFAVLLALSATTAMAWFENWDDAVPGDYWMGTGGGWLHEPPYTERTDTDQPYTYTPAGKGIDGTVAASGYYGGWAVGSATRPVEADLQGFYTSFNASSDNWNSTTTSYSYVGLRQGSKWITLWLTGTYGTGAGVELGIGAHDGAAYTGRAALMDLSLDTWYDVFIGVDLVNGEFAPKIKAHNSSTWTDIPAKAGYGLFLPAEFAPAEMTFYGFNSLYIDNTGTVVPEPGALMALGSGLIGLVGFSIRRRK